MNKKIKKMLAISLSILCLFACLNIQVVAVDDYDCGDDVVWTLSEDNAIITISGSGDMYNYSLEACSPWESSKTDITALIITDEVTNIGQYAFVDCTSLNTVYISQSVDQIKSYAFYNCTDIDVVYYASTQEAWEDILIETDNDSLATAQIVYDHVHIDEDDNRVCDECFAQIQESSWSLWSFITSIFAIVKGYVNGFISLLNSLDA